LREGALRGGTDFAVYPDEEFDPQDLTVVAGISLSLDADVPANDAGVESRTFGGGRSVVGTLRGPYEAEGESRMSQAWMEVWGWIAEHGYQRRAPGYELYIVGFSGSNDPAQFVTELVVPIA
jgi:effector-binding domain-containing protein